MDIFAFPPLAALLNAAYGALAGLSDLLTPLAGASAAALAVVLVTLLVRALLIPVGISQAKAEQTRARLAPRLRELQRRHKKNPERLQKEMLELYRSENTSPFAGMLPVLAQAPVVGILYTLFLRPEIAGHPNELLTHDLFGAPLGTSLVSALFGGTATPATFLVFGVLLSLEPAFATLAGWLILGQDATSLRMLAVALVIAASVGTTLGVRRDRRDGPAGPFTAPIPLPD